MLDGMAGIPAGETLFDTAARLQATGSKGLLVSGGSTCTGGCRCGRTWSTPASARKLGMSVIVHSGVVSRSWRASSPTPASTA
ncbi:MAG: hypothetical protein R2734_08435 [Nocardioides sp.]